VPRARTIHETIEPLVTPLEAAIFLPQTYLGALALMLLSMLCWGSWANTQKADSGWRFELFYLDYNIGLLAFALLGGLTLGNLGHSAESFFVNLGAASPRAILFALAGGVVFTAGNMLLVAAISVAGMAVAFPVGSGLALVLGAVLNYIIAPSGNPVLIFSGVAFVCVAVALDALAYRAHPSPGSSSGDTGKGLLLSVFGGIGAGLFYPLVAKSLHGEGHLTPYTVNVVFSIGAALSAIPIAWIFMRHPVSGSKLSFADYFAGQAKQHAWGIAGGLLWGLGTIANFVASAVPMIGPATSFSLGEGNTMISALWGVFVWHEFRGATGRVKLLLALMFAAFLLGLTSIALSPILH
jgi:glucose uptake protein